MKLYGHLLAIIIASPLVQSIIAQENGANDSTSKNAFAHNTAENRNAKETIDQKSYQTGMAKKDWRAGDQNDAELSNGINIDIINKSTKTKVPPNRTSLRKLSQFPEHEINVGTSSLATKTFKLPFSNMLVFPTPINKEDNLGGRFTVTVTGCTLTVLREYGSGIGWSKDLKLLAVEVSDPSDWIKYNVGSQNQNGPAERQLPESNMNALPYPANPSWGFSDTFAVDVSGTTLTVTRNDEGRTWDGWGQSLELYISPSSAKEPGPRQMCESSPVPSLMPSSAPVPVPSSIPSSSPVISSHLPTLVPSVVPSPCVEKSVAKFYIESKANGEVMTSSCRVLARKKKKKIRKECKKMDSGGGYFSAKQTCPVTCGSCPIGSCGEIDTGKFYDKSVKKERNCSWLAQRNSGRVRKICDQISAPGGKLVANEVCQSTCDSCSSI